MISQA